MNIFIGGPESDCKTSIINLLQKNGYNASSSALLDRLSKTSVKELPTEIVGMSKNNLHIFTPELLNSSNINNFDAGDRYIIVNDMSNTHMSSTHMTDNDESTPDYKKLQRKKYYRSKLLYLSYKYNIPYFESDSKNQIQVRNSVFDFVSGKWRYFHDFECCKNKYKFEPTILELEWLNFGTSKIIFADANCLVLYGTDNTDDTENSFDLGKYQNQVLDKIQQNEFCRIILE